MKSVEQIAELIVEQWDKHDKFREHETVLFNNGVEPDEVALARAFLDVLESLNDMLEFEGLGPSEYSE